MKLKLLALGALLAVAPAAAASDLLLNNPDNAPYFGARIGIDITSAANGGAWYSNKAGISVGAVYNIPIYANLYFEPGLSAFYDAFGTHNWKEIPSVALPVAPQPSTGSDDKEESRPLYSVDGYIGNFGFRVPLNLGYHFDLAEDLSVHVFTGPQLNLSLVARYHQKAYRQPTQTTNEQGQSIIVPGKEVGSVSEGVFGTGGFKHFDMQWNFGAGLTYGSYFVSVNGSVGITRLCDATPLFHKSIRRSLCTITLGYNF